MPSHPIPTLTTDRLILRAPVAADFPDFARLMASPRAAYMGGPYTKPAAWGLFCHDIACWHLFGHGGLMIDQRATGECLGSVGINHGPLFPEKELGWQLYDGHEGHGYATEAAAALLRWAIATARLDRLVSYVHPANRRSAAIAERLGARLDPDAPRTDPTDLVYRHQPSPC
jgi:RimJ/RimL family protein N-acetyltransferase